MKSSKIYIVSSLLISIIYFLLFIVLVLIVQTNPHDRAIPNIVVILFVNYWKLFVFMPLLLLIVNLIIIRLIKRTTLYYILLVISLVNFILGGFCMQLWNPYMQ